MSANAALEPSRPRGGRYAWGDGAVLAWRLRQVWVRSRQPSDPSTQHDAGGTPAS